MNILSGFELGWRHIE
uniref:Uncharacterized protein n=1 Tax=Globodera pallida TaxID=36090 RepID=A0A183CQC3_GLOPA